MVSRDGYVKILDFGLAKLTETPAQDASVLPTAIAAPTEPGTVMGTAGYMSPEQASGQSVDYRSDQFSFGAILYEMATGKRAFQRKTGAETLVAIIREEPEPLSQAAPKAPAPVRWIVERLLAKDPEERYASTKDLARDLKSLRDHLTETSVSGALAPAEPTRTRRRGRLALATATLLVGAALGFLARTLVGGAHAPLKLQRLTYARGSIHCARFAPDGQTIIYSAAWEGRPVEIFSTRADSTESRSLGLTGADLLAVSSQGELALSLNRRHLFGFETAGTLARVPLAGGAPREVLEDVEDADWAPDGKTLAVVRLVGNSCRLEYPIGKVLFEAPGWISNVRVSPDGRSIAFVDHPQKGDNNGSVKVVDVSGKLRVTGPNAQRGLAWSLRSDEIWSTGGDDGILATTLSGKTRQAWNSPGANLADIGRDGRVLFQSNISRREIVAVSGQDGVERNLTWFDWSFPIDLARDGRTLLFMEQNIQPPGVYLRKLDGSPAIRLGDGYTFALSPDGRSALASRDPAKGQTEPSPNRTGRTEGSEPNGPQHAGRLLDPQREPRPDLRQRAGTPFTTLGPGRPERQAARHQPGGSQLRLFDSLSGRQVGRGPRPGAALWPLPSGAGRAPALARTRSGRGSGAVVVGRPRRRRVQTGGGSSACRALRRGDGRPEAVEGDSTSRSLRHRPGRADPHFLGHGFLRLFLPPQPRRSLSRDGAALKR